MRCRWTVFLLAEEKDSLRAGQSGKWPDEPLLPAGWESASETPSAC